MNISINWLNKYVNLEKIEPKEIANKLTMATVEVEGLNYLAEQLENIFVGKVIKLFPHPNADKLKLADVDLGKETVRVVCGGSNLAQGMLVALAKPGSMVRWHGEGDPVKLEPTKIRGEKSFGMICAADEIGLGEIFDHKNGDILNLSELNLEVGQNLAEALGVNDYVLDIDNKSLTNRPDLWSHYGIARELGALYDLKLELIKSFKIKEEKEIDLKLKVNDSKLCPAYYGIAMNNIKVGPSPKWLKQSLQSIGQKSINNIVDITNYVLFEMGQPIHAFDAKKLKDNQISVRLATPGEKLITLDGEQRTLGEEMLVIADSKNAVALAGIMGGQNSEISDKTDSIIIESANFDPVNIRRTAMKLGLRTEASMRFEKSLDPTNAHRALERVIELIMKTQPKAKAASNIVRFEKFKLDQGPIELPKDFLLKRIGQEVKDKEVERILQSLGFRVKDKRKTWEVNVPTWRATGDISIKEDLIEEVSRILGYDNIAFEMPKAKNLYLEPNKERNIERQVKDFLIMAENSIEVRNYSFVKRDILDKINVDHSNYWQLENPWDENENLMRQNLWPHLIINVKDNLRFFEKVNIFEIGRVFLIKDSYFESEPNSKKYLPAQPYFLSGAYMKVDEQMPFYRVKQIVESLLTYLQIDYSINMPKENQHFQHPFRSANIIVNDKEIGWITELHPLIAKKLEIDEKVGLWQLNFDELSEIVEPKYGYEPVNKYPSVVYDLSIIVDEKAMYKDIAQIIRTVDPKLIKRVDLLDIFKNGKIKAGKKSITIRITYQSEEKTLEKEEVEKLQKKVVKQLESGVGAELRA